MTSFRFNAATRGALDLSRAEAARLGHEYIGTEHILLGLLRSNDPGFDTLARRLKLDRPAVAAKLESVIKGGKPSESTATLDLPYTSRSKRVLELALESARAMATTDVGPEHLLAGLCAEEKNIAAMVLSEFGVGRSEVRAALNAPD